MATAPNPKTEPVQAGDAWRRIVLENALDAVIGMDQDGLIIDWNRQAEVTFGWNKDEILGRLLSEVIIPPEHRAAHEHGMRHFLTTGEGPVLNHRIEITALHRNGSIFPVELTIIPVRDAGRFMFYSFIRDITERKRAQESDQDHARLLSGIIEGIADAVFVKDRYGRYLVINSAGAAMLRKPREQVLGKDDTDFFSPEGAAKIMADDRKVMETGEPTPFEETDRTDGQARVFSSMKSPYRDHQGRIVGIIGVARDITEKKRAEDAIRESEDRFRTLFEQAPFSVQLFCTQGRVLMVNRAWIELWKVPQRLVDDFILKEYNVLDDPQLKNKGILPYLQRGFAGESTATPAILYDPAELGQPGRRRWVEGFIHPIKDPGGKVREVMVIHDDVTERRDHELERDRLVGELQEAVRARDEFLSIASHELKTPLTSLKLQAQMNRRRLERGDSTLLDPKNLAKYVQGTDRQVNRLARLVEDMLDISRIAHGKLKVEREEFELGLLVRDVADRFADVLDASGCKCRITTESKIVGRWDRYRIEQVVSNLLTNVGKYGAGKPVEISVTSDGAHAVVQVRDFGMGIAQENLKRVFQRFERAISASAITGLGLGLYISRQIVEAHGGEIWAESEVGKGSTFFVRLPLA